MLPAFSGASRPAHKASWTDRRRAYPKQRRMGSWSTLRWVKIHFKSDERILGDSDFVDKVLKTADEALERKYQLKTQGYDLNALAGRVAEIFSIKPEEIFQPGKQPVIVKTRSLFCHWAVHELGFTMTGLAQKLKISQPAISISVQRGARIEEKNGYLLITE
jgi:hypothetical protein